MAAAHLRLYTRLYVSFFFSVVLKHAYVFVAAITSQSLRKVGQDSTVLLICITVFLSYLPEAGQYSSFFLYLRQVKLFDAQLMASLGVILECHLEMQIQYHRSDDAYCF